LIYVKIFGGMRAGTHRIHSLRAHKCERILYSRAILALGAILLDIRSIEPL